MASDSYVNVAAKNSNEPKVDNSGFSCQEQHAQTCVVDNSMARQIVPSISSRQPRALEQL